MSTFQAPKGTYDLIPPESAKYLAVREAIATPLRNSGYGYIETPASRTSSCSRAVSVSPPTS